MSKNQILKIIGGLILALALSNAVYALATTVSCSPSNSPANPIYGSNGVTGIPADYLPSGKFVQIIQSDDSTAGAPSQSNGLPTGDTVIATGTLSANGTFSGSCNISAGKYVYIRAWDTWNGSGAPTGKYGTSTPANVGSGFTYTYKPASFATTTPINPPGTLQFSAATYSVNENGNTVTITVTRTGGSSGAASVEYFTSDDTAKAGQDYIAASGTLSWANGDSSSKTFTVTILDDSVYEGNETFKVTLSNASGATLGSPSSATVTIVDNETPPPTITGITWVPNNDSGFVYGTIKITGSNFGDNQGSSTVELRFQGGSWATVPGTQIYSWSNTQIEVGIPNQIGSTYAVAGTTDVRVTVSGASATSTFALKPRIYSTNPTSGSVGTSVTINGTAFGANPANIRVSFNGTNATPSAANNTTLTVTVPSGATTGPVTVTLNGQTSNNDVSFTVKEEPAPSLSVSPTSLTFSAQQGGANPANQNITISNTGGGTLTWNASKTQSWLTINPASGSCPPNSTMVVSVKDISGLTAGTYTDTITITSNGGNQNVSVTLNVTTLPNTAPVANNVTVSTTKNTPIDVSLSATDADGDTLTYSIVSQPAHGTLGSVSGNKVTYTPATDYVGTDSFTFKANDGQADSNTATVSITVSDVTPTTPSIKSILPSVAAIGQTIVISGSNFGATKESSTVTVGGVVANPTAWSANSITLAVPTGVASGTASVVVTVSGRQASGSITVDPSKIIIDDFEGGSVGSFAGNGLADSGYYAYGTGITPDNNNINANGPQAEAKHNGARGMKVKYSYASDWGGGWGARVSNSSLDLTSAQSINFFIKWDGSSNDIKFGLKDSDGTAVSATVSNATLMSRVSNFGEVSILKSAFSYDSDGSDKGADATFDWSKVTNYNFTYITKGTTSNYQYIDDIVAVVQGTVVTSEVQITSINPSAAPAGTKVTLTGVGFGASQGQSNLIFANTESGRTYPIEILSWNDTTIEAIVPPAAPAGYYDFKVIKRSIIAGTVNALESNTQGFQVTSAMSTAGIATIYPNPFNPNATGNAKEAKIVYNAGSTTRVGIYIYDTTARLVYHTVVSGNELTWDGRDAQGNVVADGVYLLRVVNEENKSLIAKGKILVVKK